MARYSVSNPHIHPFRQQFIQKLPIKLPVIDHPSLPLNRLGNIEIRVLEQCIPQPKVGRIPRQSVVHLEIVRQIDVPPGHFQRDGYGY